MKELFSQLSTQLDREFVKQSQFEVLNQRIEELEKSVSALREQEKPPARKIYYVADLAELMLIDANTVRRDYLTPGRISGSKNASGSWEISRDEYERVCEIVSTRSKHHL